MWDSGLTMTLQSFASLSRVACLWGVAFRARFQKNRCRLRSAHYTLAYAAARTTNLRRTKIEISLVASETGRSVECAADGTDLSIANYEIE